MTSSAVQPVRIIACGVFRPALEYLHLEKKYADLRVTFLESSLHICPQELKDRLRKEISCSKKRNEHVHFLYGECFRNMGIFCRKHGVSKIQCEHCYEIFLGSERFCELMDENAGTYFLEQDLILNFEEYCIRPMELHDPEMKEMFFKNYKRLIYIRQPADPDLGNEIKKIADFLDMSVTIKDADYSQLKNDIMKILKYRTT